MTVATTATTDGNDLTTTRAAFIERAAARGDLFIQQPYHLYSDANQRAWCRLVERMRPRWESFACAEFLAGQELIDIAPDRIPRLDEINTVLEARTGFRARAVRGYVPAYVFFDCLARREFPTTITVRDEHSLDYLPEPDIFHDVAGHVPMHTNREFAGVLTRFGAVARRAAERAATEIAEDRRLAVLESNVRALARFFWFTVEFGLVVERGDLRAYGSGLLSSHAELAHAINSRDVERRSFGIWAVVHQPFEIDQFQPRLFVVDAVDQLAHEVRRLEAALEAGALDAVRGGEPEIDPADLMSFMAGAPSANPAGAALAV